MECWENETFYKQQTTLGSHKPEDPMTVEKQGVEPKSAIQH